MEIVTFFLLIGLALIAGFIGAMLGLGGGVILVPGLTLLFNYDVKIAIAASVTAVIATSTAAATVYVKERFTNIRLGMVLEIATTLGALIGAAIAVYIAGRYLYFIFAVILIYAGIIMLRKTPPHDNPPEEIAAQSSLNGRFTDPLSGQPVSYVVKKMNAGLAGSTLAGMLSGLLGIGGGIVKVPLMNVIMRIPIRAAIATSNFMIGVTGATSAVVYWANGLIDPGVTTASVLGVLIGARIGTKVGGRLRTRALVLAFVVLIIFTAVQMVLKGMKV